MEETDIQEYDLWNWCKISYKFWCLVAN